MKKQEALDLMEKVHDVAIKTFTKQVNDTRITIETLSCVYPGELPTLSAIIRELGNVFIDYATAGLLLARDRIEDNNIGIEFEEDEE